MLEHEVQRWRAKRSMTDGLAHAFAGSFGGAADGASYVLPSTVDVSKILTCLAPLERAVRSLVHDFADVGWLDVVTDVGLVRVVSAARDPMVERALEDVAPTPIANGSGFRWRNADDETTPICNDHHDVLRALRARSFLREPLLARDSVLGALTLASTRAEVRFGLRDLRTLEACARGLAYLLEKHAIAD